MSKSIVLSFGSGDLRCGFPQIQVEIREIHRPAPIKLRASLPAAPDLVDLYRRWQMLYREYYQQINQRSQQLDIVIDPDLDVDDADLTNFSEIDFEELKQRLPERLNDWLDSEGFRATERQLRTLLDPQEEIQITIETEDNQVRQLPWCLWRFLDDYVNAEIELSNLEYRPSLKRAEETNKGVRILVLLGNSEGIDVTPDQQVIKQLAGAKPEFLIEPSSEAVSDRLWNQSWDILFFAGHSSSQETAGCFYLNQTEKLTIDDLRPALRTAIANGLKLAIFNSCDGSKLATELADLHIPAIIVMREPIPDAIAHRFLKYFLEAFSAGFSLHKAFRDAREKLRIQQRRFPCADWLPMLFRNPTEVAPIWYSLLHKRPIEPQKPRIELYKGLQVLLLISLIATSTVAGIRHAGHLERQELMAYDWMMRSRPHQGPDRRLLVITVGDEDFKLPEQRNRKQISLSNGNRYQYSLAPEALEVLLQELQQYKPRVIGIDLFLDYEHNLGKLKTLQQEHNLYTICYIAHGNEKNSFKPSPNIPIERHGFSDTIKDLDRVVRRQILSVGTNQRGEGIGKEKNSLCAARESFALQVARHYLKEENIFPKYTPTGNLKLNHVELLRLKSPSTAYQNQTIEGNQVLLSYRLDTSLTDFVSTFTLTEFLNQPHSLSDLSDRIVLIGPKNSTDMHMTPDGVKIPGVILQAQMTSQLLSAALDGRSPIRPLAWWQDILWIFGWSLVGGLSIWHSSTAAHKILITVGIMLGFTLICYLLFLRFYWLPLVPSVITIATTNVGTVIYLYWTKQHHVQC